METGQIKKTISAYEQELSGILSRFNKTRDSIYIDGNDHPRFRQLVIELRDFFNDVLFDGQTYSSMIVNYFSDGISNFTRSPSYYSVESILGIISAAKIRIERNPEIIKSNQQTIQDTTPSLAEKINFVEKIAERFHLLVRQLRERYSNRPTLDVDDEYDVQDLFHVLLRLEFDDVRKEEWTPSYAGGSSRIDFLIPTIETVIEIKMTRKRLNARQVGEQLIVDIAKYKTHPQCRTLICFVYDPEGRITNPVGLENDLNDSDSDINVKVIIEPK